MAPPTMPPSSPVAETEEQELFQGIASKNFLGFSFNNVSYDTQIESAVRRTEALCAVQCYVCSIPSRTSPSGTRKVVWMRHQFQFIGGSLGCAEGEKLCAGFEYARSQGLGVVVECRSGGARLQEGTLSLMQMGKVSVAVNAFRNAGLPYVSILLDPCYGGVSASYALQSDVKIALRNTRIGFAGPSVICNTMHEGDRAAFEDLCPSDFQTAEYLSDRGTIDIVADSLDVAKAHVSSLMDAFLGGQFSASSAAPRRTGGLGTHDKGVDGGMFKRVASHNDDLHAEVQRLRELHQTLPPPSGASAPGASPEGANAAEPSFTDSRDLKRYLANDVVRELFSDFVELRGDGRVACDRCIHGGVGFMDGIACVVVGHYKAHEATDMGSFNHGMAAPEGYRYAQRMMALAERFGLGVVSLIDTPGALPSVEAESHGQAEAIASSLVHMAGLRVPIVSVVLGEGGSGGALGIGVANRVGMLSRGYYSVISPEGAASILGRYRSEEHRKEQFGKDCSELAQMQRIYAPQLKELGVVDEVIWEGVHGNGTPETYDSAPETYSRLREFLSRAFRTLRRAGPEVLIADRYDKFRNMGKFDVLSAEQFRATVERISQTGVPRAAGSGAQSSTSRSAQPAAARPSRTLQFLAEQTVNSLYSAHFGKSPAGAGAAVPVLPARDASKLPQRENAKAVLDRDGPEALARWVRSRSRPLITDTTMRDAHQSLLATRVRTHDLFPAARESAHVLHDAFSLEVWGGATFDVCYRFLHEDPWERLRALRRAAPNSCLQMLIRGSNAVGYTSYPDNVVEEFVRLAAKNGVDIFRIFDCFNDVDQMRVCIDAVRKEGKVAEVCLCFTGDFTRDDETIYTLDYYRKVAADAVDAGAHFIGIKDMAGLLRPPAASALMAAIREVTDLPVHYHAHNTSSVALTTIMRLVEAGCDIVDVAIASMADTTSQPSLNALVAATAGTVYDTGIDYLSLEPLDSYWAAVRSHYEPFESGLKSGSARVFEHQIPGGQYSNLYAQSHSVALRGRWSEVLEMYRDVNELFGNIIKVTPSSKCVGDMALFLLQRGLTCNDVRERGECIAFPQSVVDLFLGKLGRPHHGFPADIQEKVLKGQVPLQSRPGELLPAYDFAHRRSLMEEDLMRPVSDEEVISAVLYPAVFKQFVADREQYGDKITRLPTAAYFYGLAEGEELVFDVPNECISDAEIRASSEPSGDASIRVRIQLKRVGAIRKQGSAVTRRVAFVVNGFERVITVVDRQVDSGESPAGIPADLSDPRQIASPMVGTVGNVAVSPGDRVAKGARLCTVCAMKLEVHVDAPRAGTVESLCVSKGDRIDTNTLLVRMVFNDAAPAMSERRNSLTGEDTPAAASAE